MDIASVFLLGVVVAIISVLPPGLLNMSAAKISLSEGRSRGIIFSIGASLVVLLQTYIGAIFAKYLSVNPDVIGCLRVIALILFALVTVYFLFIAKNKERSKKERRQGKKSSFFYGMFLSVLNVFPVPYQAYMTITLTSYGLMSFDKTIVLTYMIGVGIGSFIALYFYILFFDRIKDKILVSQKNMNYIIGGITGVISIITLFNVVKNM